VLTGQSPNHTYTVYGFAQASNGLYYNCGSATITTQPIEIQAPTNLRQDVVNTTTSSIRVTWNASSNAQGYKIYFNGSFITTTTSTSAVININGASPSGSYGYSVGIVAYNASGESSFYDCYDFYWPKPSTPIEISHSSTINSITIDWNDQTTPMTVSKWYCYWKLPSDSVDVYNSHVSTVTVSNATWGSLTPNTQYNLRIKASIISGYFVKQEIISDPLDLTYSTLNTTRPESFKWTYVGKQNGVPILCNDTIGYNKIAGYEFYVTQDEWNSLQNRINAFRTYKGLATASYTVAVNGQNFIATQFNQARNNMSTIPGIGTLPSLKSSGNPVNASDLNLLKDTLNAIP
jgi:hypothetical protein